MNYNYKEGWWETKDHKKIRICDMETSHIENTIKYLQRHEDFYDNEYEFYDYDTGEFFYDYSDNSYLVDEKIEELKYELDRRKGEIIMNREKLEKGFCKGTITDETLTKANTILVIKCANLEQQVKKQKEEINDYKEDISNLLDIINKNCNELKCNSDEWLVIQKYQNKEVSK